MKGRSNEIIVSDANGVWETSTINRRPIGDRCDIANADQIQFVPWKVKEDDEKADGELMVAAKLSEEEVRDQLKEREFDMGGEAMSRRFRIAKADLWKHGYSARCDGCKAALEGKPSQNHSEECRRRILEAIGKDDPRLDAQRRDSTRSSTRLRRKKTQRN